MSDFPHVVKYLGLGLARVATRDELNAATRCNNPDKSLDLVGPSRHIKRLTKRFVIPAHTVVDNNLTIYPRLAFQYNITAESNLYILDVIGRANITNGFLCVKYTNTNRTVCRYILCGNPLVDVTWPEEYQLQIAYFDTYVAQLVKSNFCIEFWAKKWVFDQSPLGITDDIVIESSILINPETADETEYNIDVAEPYDVADLGFEFPVTFPIAQANLAYISNP